MLQCTIALGGAPSLTQGGFKQPRFAGQSVVHGANWPESRLSALSLPAFAAVHVQAIRSPDILCGCSGLGRVASDSGKTARQLHLITGSSKCQTLDA